MTTQAVSLELEPRETLGKKVKALRRTGVVPVHLYGRGVESRAPAVRGAQPVADHQPSRRRARRTTHEHQHRRGVRQPTPVEASEIQWDPRTGDVLHVDFRTVSS